MRKQEREAEEKAVAKARARQPEMAEEVQRITHEVSGEEEEVDPPELTDFEWGREVMEMGRFDPTGPRFYDGVELGSGHGQCAQIGNSKGERWIEIGKKGDPDLATPTGLAHAMGHLRKIKPGGLLIIHPPGDTWDLRDSNQTKRTAEDPEGDLTQKRVLLQNYRASSLAALASEVSARDGHWLMTLPSGSRILNYPARRRLVRDSAQPVRRVLTPLCADGGPPNVPMGLAVVGTAPGIDQISRRCVHQEHWDSLGDGKYYVDPTQVYRESSSWEGSVPRSAQERLVSSVQDVKPPLIYDVNRSSVLEERQRMIHLVESGDTASNPLFS